MEYTEDKMVRTFIKRYRNSNDIITEKRIALKFIKQKGLSIFKFINRLREQDEEICKKFTDLL